MQIRRAITALILGLTIGWPARAQQPELSIFVQQPQPLHTDSLPSPWRFGLDLATFMRDAEFSLPYTSGYTATGFFLNPTVSHAIGAHGRVETGLHLAAAAGHDGLHSWQPLVRLEYAPADGLRLVMGTLYGNLSHGLYEPMYDRERYIYAHHEEGVQLLIGTARWHSDTWLHWENLLEPWQADQERFTLASANEITPINLHLPTFNLQLSLPFAFLGSHRGGQFSSLDTCIQSLFTENVGLRLDIRLSAFSLQLHAPWFFYQDISPTSWQAYDRGHGFWPHAVAEYRHAAGWHAIAALGCWQGHQYIAPRGSYLFQSVSWHRPDFSEADRRMLTARVAIEKNIADGFTLGADCEVYHNLTAAGTDIAFGLVMRYTPSWKL